MIIKSVVLLIILGLIIVSSCYYDSEEALFPKINTSCDTTNITYSGTVTIMLNNYCLSCHSGGGTTVLATYAEVSAKSDRITGSIEHKSGFLPMPQGGTMLDSCLIKQFVKWVKIGKPNN